MFRPTDFETCGEPTLGCAGYYCGNSGATCYLRDCVKCNKDLRCNKLSDDDKKYKFFKVPACYFMDAQALQATITAAIEKVDSPPEVMRNTASACGVLSQMVVLNYGSSSSRTVVDIINLMAPWRKADAPRLTAYEIQLGFLYQPDEAQAKAAIDKFSVQLMNDGNSIYDRTASTTSVDGGRASAIFLNTSLQLTPTTFSIQRCEDGTVVTVQDTCPVAVVDPALVAAASASSTSTSSTTRLLTIILPIVGGVVFITLIVAAVVIVRRRQANKVMRQTEKHTESAVELTMA